ncbi:hypothetical protein EYZ11_005122 [Aspergillus tanneri]|uniref:N-acetylglucosamine-induced protein 1 n=1 Tax=Aspergillus tanneri TaxID=1220188 RepID=A0A4S3JL58_9EURO|nr:uncharacterized protein ATNIH1004_008225 [Aspergillus tanneri]KAA8644029.1 hypothetical protein ATNIH1004_008225 [Aspergillus tanneri]THC95398.1 hypothetical protein EYZ11_005122 [Aspergillus tanneri]
MTLLEEPPAFNLTETDRQVLAQTDEEFEYHDWEALKDIIARNDLGVLKRKPSDLIRYLAWAKDIKTQYGSITAYICLHRLHWHLPDPTANGGTGEANSGPVFPFNNPIPFADPSDYKILRNDWPYGWTPGISHLIVWLKTPVSVHGEDGDVTEESRSLIERFVQKTFVDRLARERDRFRDPWAHVLWFKNWTALQSVRSLEHIHVLLKDVPEYIIRELTGEDARHLGLDLGKPS